MATVAAPRLGGTFVPHVKVARQRSAHRRVVKMPGTPTATPAEFFAWLRDVLGIVEPVPPRKTNLKEVRFTASSAHRGGGVGVEVVSFDLDADGKYYALMTKGGEHVAAERVRMYPVPRRALGGLDA